MWRKTKTKTSWTIAPSTVLAWSWPGCFDWFFLYHACHPFTWMSEQTEIKAKCIIETDYENCVDSIERP